MHAASLNDKVEAVDVPGLREMQRGPRSSAIRQLQQLEAAVTRGTRVKHLARAEVEEIARKATQEALTQLAADNSAPREFWSRLVRGISCHDRRHHEFSFYLPRRRPQDAMVISRTTVDGITGEVEVEVFVDVLKEAMTTPDEPGHGVDY